MANTKSAEKRAREALVRRAQNVAHRSKVRSAVRRVVVAIRAGSKKDAQAALKDAVPVIDAMARKGIIHRNKASRHKSRLAGQIKAMA
ncbi:MAG: 30S ribosomal protein S20 [Gammaproteobacteria bacterium]